MRMESANFCKYTFSISGLILIIFFVGCDTENPALQPAISGDAVEAFDRDGQEYFFRLPDGFVPVDFQASYWMPLLGSDKTSPEPHFWQSFYLSEWEVEKRGIQAEKLKVTVDGIEKELPSGDRVVMLVVPKRYESWYNQAYEVELFDDMRMIYEKEVRFP